MIQNNYICGPGYPASNSGGLFAIDVTATNNPTVKNNTICSSAPAAMASALAAPRGSTAKASPAQ